MLGTALLCGEHGREGQPGFRVPGRDFRLEFAPRLDRAGCESDVDVFPFIPGKQEPGRVLIPVFKNETSEVVVDDGLLTGAEEATDEVVPPQAVNKVMVNKVNNNCFFIMAPFYVIQ